jgi:Domain of unknown function (DUF4349)
MTLRHIANALALLSGLAFGTCASAQAAQPVAVGASLTIQVSDRDKAAAAAIAKVESLGGYFSLLNDDAVTLKVPADRSRELIDFVKTNWKPVEETFRAEDVGASLDELRASLKAKQELFAQFEKLLAAADATGILEVEAAGARLIGEIETLKGRLGALRHRLDFATVVVNFRLLTRERPRDDDVAPFPWLNAIGLNALLREFER